MLVENPKLVKLWKDLAYYNRGKLLWFSPLFWPLSILYGEMQRFRRGLYNWGIIRGENVDVPVISVGNLTVGGVGKTPFAIYAALHLKEMGYNPAILFRGYKRQSDEAVVLTSDTFDHKRIMEYGDEPAMVCFTAGIPCGIYSERSVTAAKLIEEYQCDVLLLDDGLQHLQLHRDIDIVLLDGNNAAGNRCCLPMGPLREPLSTLKSVHAVVFRDASPLEILPQAFAGQVFEGRLHWTGICPFEDWRRRNYTSETPIKSYHSQSVILISGIGNPERLEHQAVLYGLDVRHHFAYPDHYWITWNEVISAGEAEPTLPILITEKDAIRLVRFKTVPVHEAVNHLYVIRAAWDMNQPFAFSDWLKQRLQERLS